MPRAQKITAYRARIPLRLPLPFWRELAIFERLPSCLLAGPAGGSCRGNGWAGRPGIFSMFTVFAESLTGEWPSFHRAAWGRGMRAQLGEGRVQREGSSGGENRGSVERGGKQRSDYGWEGRSRGCNEWARASSGRRGRPQALLAWHRSGFMVEGSGRGLRRWGKGRGPAASTGNSRLVVRAVPSRAPAGKPCLSPNRDRGARSQGIRRAGLGSAQCSSMGRRGRTPRTMAPCGIPF